MDERLQQVLDYIEEHKEEYVELLRRFCRQPSVAATGEGIREMAGMVYEELEKLNAGPEMIETGGSPFIYAQIKGDVDRTFGFYDHYDVQPVDPINEWIVDPYSAEIIDGVIYARGVADNKDGLVTRLCAVDAWQKVHGKLPLNVKFLFEGEEEIGSPHLVSFAKAHPDMIQCDGYVWEGGNREPGGPAEITMGVKGLLYVELHAKVSEKDAHSMNAAIMPSATWRLVWALNTLKDQEGNILIDGFYDGIPPISQAEMEALKTDVFSEEASKEILGIDEFLYGMTGDDLLTHLYYKPTCNICGITAGYQGEGSKTVLPGKASCKIDFRLVPGQDPQRILGLLRAHLDKHGFSDIEVKCNSGCPAHRSDPEAPFCKAVIRSMEKLFNEQPCIQCTSGGTSPMYAFCADTNIPAAMFGASSETANIHAPNEHLAVDAFIDMIRVTATVMHEFAVQE
ncbi:M20/M25/M40 family metallo-hydrolase [Ruminococcaceae bacterium OttesenSCG-928-O06]|nr:M20/M25/M40 family metallo-hydrolase [Ruminococcaceae bacterium OttesenSCG-928-O06]